MNTLKICSGVLGAVVLAACAPAPAPNSAPPPPAAAADTGNAPAQRAFRDPVTGELRAPTREELRQLSEQALPSAPAKVQEAPRVVTYPDGTVGVFPGKPRHQVKARVGKDGSVTTYEENADRAGEQP